jgi:hypothetical protein
MPIFRVLGRYSARYENKPQTVSGSVAYLRELDLVLYMNPKPLYCDILIADGKPSVVHVRKASTTSDVIVDKLDLIGQVQMRMLTERIGCAF